MTQPVRPPRHTKVAKRAEDLSMTVGIISTAVSLGAAAAEPTGLSAVAVFMGFEDPPLIVELAPLIGNIATVTAIFSGVCFVYSKLKS